MRMIIMIGVRKIILEKETIKQLNKLEFGGESPRTMRARCSGFRYCPDPLGIVTAKQLDKLELDEQFSWL